MKSSNLPFGNCMKHGLKLYVGSIKQQLTEGKLWRNCFSRFDHRLKRLTLLVQFSQLIFKLSAPLHFLLLVLSSSAVNRAKCGQKRTVWSLSSVFFFFVVYFVYFPYLFIRCLTATGANLKKLSVRAHKGEGKVCSHLDWASLAQIC